MKTTKFTVVLEIIAQSEQDEDTMKHDIERFFTLKNLDKVLINNTDLRSFEIINICEQGNIARLREILSK